MKFTIKRLLALTLAVIMVLSLMPTAALADTTDTSRNPSGFITGGTIGGTVDASYLADGYTVDSNGTVTAAPAYPVYIDAAGYDSLDAALDAAMTGDVTVEIYDKVTLNTALSGSYDSIKFVGKDTDAEIYLDVQGYITANGKKVAFEDLTLSKSAGGFINNAGFMNVAFGVYQANEVTYTRCTFANGAYGSGKAAFTGCTFYRSHDKYGLWAYGDAEVTVNGCTFADYRGIKMYAEGGAKTVDLTVKNTNFSAVNDKPAIVLTYGESVTLSGNTYSSTGVFELDLDGAPNGTAVTSDVLPTCKNDNGACGVLVDGKIYTTVAQAAAVATSGSTVTLLHNSAETVELPEGVTLNKNGFTAAGITVAVSVAKIGEQGYSSLQEAVNAVQNGETITLLTDWDQDVTVVQAPDVAFTIDGADKTMSGAITVDGKSAAYATAGLTIQNVNFDATGIDEEASINLGVSGNNNTRYVSNLTVNNCTFTGTGQAKVAIKSYTGGDKNLTVTGCTATGMHSLAQLKNVAGVKVSGCEVTNSKNGISLGASTNAVVESTTITATGYGIRADAAYNNTLTIKDCRIEAFIPVCVRNASAAYQIVMDGTNTMTATNTDNLWCAIGTSEYEKNGVLPAAATGKVTVTLNGTGLNMDGVYGNYAEAEVNGVLYASLQEAVNVGGTVKVLRDIELSEGVTVAAEKTVTLDLNGYTLSYNHEGATASSLIENKGTLTIMDSSEEKTGEITASATNPDTNAVPSYANNTITNYGTLNIEGGTIENTTDRDANDNTARACYPIDNQKSGVLNISGGKISGRGAIRQYCTAMNNTVNITGGTITGTSYAIWTQSSTSDPVAELKISGGTLTGGSYGVLLDPNANLDVEISGGTMSAVAVWGPDETNTSRNPSGFISGGYYADDSFASYLAEGYELDYDLNKRMFSVKAQITAIVGGQTYSDLQAAINAADGKTVYLKRDVTLTETLTVAAGQTVTLDLNGKTITYNSTTQGESMITNKGNLTINDSVGTGVINYNYTGAADSTYKKGNFTITNSGTLTVNGGKITIANLSQHAKYPIDNNSTTGDAVLIINGGHLYNYNTSAIRQFCNSTSYKNSVTINGGKIEGYSAIWVQNPNNKTVNGQLTITGGEIKSTAKKYVDGTQKLEEVGSAIYFTISGDGGAWDEASFVNITGGTFNENVYLAEEAPAEIVISDNAATFNGYLELPVVVAKIGTKGFTTLSDAIDAAVDGQTIELIWKDGDAPIAMNGEVYGKTVTITGTATVDWSKGFLFVGRGGEGNGTVIFDNANLISASDQASTGIHVSGKEKGEAAKNDGTLVIRNSTIELDYLIQKHVMTLDNSTLTVKNGCSLGGRPASETESGKDATATTTLSNGSKLIINNHNGMGLGYEAIGVLNVESGSAFETTQSFLITAKGTLNVTGDNVKISGTLENNGTISVSGESAIDATVTGSGWVYMNGATLDANTNLIGAKVAFINGTNTIVGSTIKDGWFSVGVGKGADAEAAAAFAAANDITLGDVTVNVSGDAVISANGDTYSGWIGSAYSADKTQNTYTLNVENALATFGYLHVSKDGVLNVKGHATNKYTYDNANVDFYAGDFIINGVVTMDGTDAWAKYTKVSVDHADGVLNIVNGTNYEASIHNGANTGDALRFYKAGEFNVDAASVVEIDNVVTLVDGAKLNLGGQVIANGAVTGTGTITLTDKNATLKAAEGLTVASGDADYNVSYVDGTYKLSAMVVVAQIGETKYTSLQEALNAAAAGTGDVTVNILSDINLTGVVWSPVTVSAPGYPKVTVNGNNKTITGLSDMLFAGTWAGGSGLIINDLTIKGSNIVNDKDDSKRTVGVGAFIGFPQASAVVTLNNCHLVNSTVEGGHWTGGLIGYAAGYAGTDGPVFMNLTITGCSVTGSTITSKGSAGGIIGHGSGNAWTNLVITDTTVSGNTITSTGSDTNKAGAVIGTIGAAGQPTTVNGETKTGGASVAATVSGNTVTSAGTTITTIYGRQGTATGMLEVAGGSYDNYPIEENVAYAAPAEGYKIEANTDGTFGVVVTLPEVVITDIKDTLADTDPDLTFALNFAIKDLEELANDTVYLEDLMAAYGDYYTDYVLTISGLTDENVTFNASGNADGYLAGQYDAWSENWVSVPFEDVTVENGESLYIMEYAAKLMGQPGLRFTLAEVAAIVQNFDCGVYFTPEFLAANPGLDVELELKVFTEDAEGNKIEDISVATNEFDKDDFGVAAVTAENKQTEYYPSLADAVAAAETGDTVKLLANVELTKSIYVEDTVIVDLNGMKLTGPDDGKANWYAFIVNGGDLTLKDSIGTGELWAKCYGVETKSGSFTMESGKITATNNTTLGTAVANYGGTVTIMGGELSGNLAAVYTGGYFSDAFTSIQKGTLNGTVYVEDWDGKSYTETVTSVSNTYAIDDTYYKWVKQDGFYVLTAKDLRVQVGDKYYETLTEAVAAAKAGVGDTITLLKDIATVGGESYVINANVTLDLNGKTISADSALSSKPVLRILSNVTIKGGTVDGTSGINSYAIIVGQGETSGNLIVENGTYKGITTAISISNGTATLKNGIFSAAHDNEGEDYYAQYVLNCIDSAYTAGKAKFIVEGGTFVGFNPQNNVAEGTGTNFCAEGYHAVDLKNGNYKVEVAPVADVVAQNTTTNETYATVEEALAAATDGQTVTLIANAEAGMLMVPAKVTLDLAGKDLTASYFVSFGNVVDGDVGGNALLKADYIRLQENNTQLPLYNADEDGYQFFAYEFKGISAVKNSNGDKLRFAFAILFENREAYELLKDEKAGLTMRAVLSWDGMKHEAVPVTFTHNAVKDWATAVCNNPTKPLTNFGVYIIITGFEELEAGSRVMVQPEFETTAGVENTTDTLEFTLQ